MDPDSCSMTPPLSPLLSVLEQQEQNHLLQARDPKQLSGVESAELFCCSGSCGQSLPKSTNPGSMLRRGVIKSLTDAYNRADVSNNKLTVELYGYQFVAMVALEEQTQQLFYLTRQNASRLELLANGDICGEEATNECVKVRYQIKEFFQYVKQYLNSCDTEMQDTSFLILLLDHLRDLMLFVGQMIDLPLEVIAAASSLHGNETSNPLHHMFHLHLEMRWGILELLHIISSKFKGVTSSRPLCVEVNNVDNSDRDLFSQAVNLLMWDFFMLAINQHSKLSQAEYGRHPPWPCSCVQELLVMVIHLLQHRQLKMSKQSCWMLLFSVVQTFLVEPLATESTDETQPMEIDSDVFMLPPDLVCTDRVGLCWYFVLHIAPLFQYSDSGYFVDTKGSLQSNYVLLQTLLKRSISLPEVQLRCHLHCLAEISKLWEPNPDILVLLWDHFYKRLNDQFRISNISLEGLQCLSKTAQGMLDQTRQLLQKDSSMLDGATSFQVFLCLLKIHLGRTQKHSTPGQTWRQVKGRFYSKFHSRRMQELTENGLNNFTLLFLTLAQVTNVQDVGEKLCDLYGLLGVGNLDVGRRTLVWHGMFALMLLYQQQGQDIYFLVDHLLPTFNILCIQLNDPGQEPMGHMKLWRLLGLYIENTQDVIENSTNLNLGEHRLLGAGFVDLLKIASENEIRTTLSFVQTVLTKHRLVYKRTSNDTAEDCGDTKHCRELADSLWQCFYWFVKQHSCTLTPPPQMADVAAGFCLLSLDMPNSTHRANREEFNQCFSYFAWGENVNPVLSCRFLCHMLPNTSVMERLQQVYQDPDSHLVRAWLRCTWHILPTTSDHLQELTRLIQRLPRVSELLSQASIHSGDGLDDTVNFFKALRVNYSSIQDFRSRMEFRDKACGFLSGVMLNVNSALKSSGSSELTRHVYMLAGQVVNHCALITYIKSKADCLLPQLVDRLALPRTLLHNKPLTGSVLSALREVLPLFLQGLSQLDYKRDPYVQRKIKDIVMHYLNKFPVQSSSGNMMVTAVHPFIRCVDHSLVRTVSEEASSFRRYLLELMCAEHLILRGTAASSTALLAWNLILEMYSRTQDAAEIARDTTVLLPITLQHSLVIESPAIKSVASSVLQHLLEASSKHTEAIDRKQLECVITNFVQKHLSVYQSRALRVLEPVSVLYPELLVPLIPTMTAEVKATETKRGVGIDKNLRVSYCAVLGNLGEAGQQEKSSVLLDAMSKDS